MSKPNFDSFKNPMAQFGETELERMTHTLASLSKAERRKVGVVIAKRINGDTFSVVGVGYNYEPNGLSCEDVEGNTRKSVIHAEVAAIDNTYQETDLNNVVMFVSHPPCMRCVEAIAKAGIPDVRIVDKGMKFDEDKTDYTKIHPQLLKALANLSERDLDILTKVVVTNLMPYKMLGGINEVLIHGAKKYKPNNWRGVEPERYLKALKRHLDEGYMKGVEDCKVSGMPHSWHIATNIAFLIELGYVPEYEELPYKEYLSDNHNRS